MEDANYAAIAALEEQNWWYVARRDLLDRTLVGVGGALHALDIGCGVGANLEVLQRHCQRVTGVDLSGWAVRRCRRIHRGEVLRADVERLPFANSAFDLVTCLDVLEHVDDEVAVAEARRVLRPGGFVVLSVPAHRFLWNDNDELSHHRRRYSRKGLERLLAGWEIDALGYWCCLPFLPALGYSLWCRLSPPVGRRNNLERVPELVGRLFKSAVLAENRVRSVLLPPVGSSLFAVARRGPGDPAAARGGRA